MEVDHSGLIAGSRYLTDKSLGVHGYSISSAKMYPGINFTGRLSTDPLGAMGSEISIVASAGADTATGNDWGNASSMSIDPADDCTFWYTNEYLTNTGTPWVTRIASFRFSSCP